MLSVHNRHIEVVNWSFSPYLNTLFNTSVTLNYDTNGIVVVDDFSYDSMLQYTTFLRTGTILPSDTIDVDLYSFMGHDVYPDVKLALYSV